MKEKNFGTIINSIDTEKQTVIKRILSDRAAVEDVPVSHVAERLLLADITKSGENGGNVEGWLTAMYAGNNSVFGALENCFGYFSGCLEQVKDFDSLLLLVKYAKRAEYDANCPPESDHYLVPYFIKHLGYLVEATDGPEFPLGEYLILKDIHREISEDFRWVSFFNLYDFVIRNWDCLKKNVDVYKLLMAMAQMQPNRTSTPKQRIELIALMKNIA